MGTQPPSPKKGQSPSAIFRPLLLWPNGCMHQDATWYKARPQPSRLCVRWGPSYPQNRRHTNHQRVFGPCLLWPNGWMDQDATWYGGRPRCRPHCMRWGPSPLPKKGYSSFPLFSAHMLWPNGRPSQLLLSSCLNNDCAALMNLLCVLMETGRCYIDNCIRMCGSSHKTAWDICYMDLY